VSFGTYARRVRDRDLSYAMRYCALRCAVSRYCPIGFHATWSFLSTVGNLKRDEEALLRALDVLETSRAAWLAEVEAFGARRRAEKQQRQQRTPSAADRLRLRGCRWPGPHGHAAVLLTVRDLWTAHLAEPFPDTPPGTKGDFVYLDSTIAGCVSTYLGAGGEVDRGRRRVLVACLGLLDDQLPLVGFSKDHYMAFRYFRRLRKLAMLVVSDA
jgi:hypothetical protein